MMADGTLGSIEPAVGLPDTARHGQAARAAIWLPGLAVAIGAAIATAHGLFEVAVAARVPDGIAWLYPLITDGLALVAYSATARLAGPPARYAWVVVVAAAGLSGLAQAAYLAGDAEIAAPAALRFGVGAWPAIAAALVAHLLFLLATADPAEAPPPSPVQSPYIANPVQQALVNDPVVQPPATTDGLRLAAPEASGERAVEQPSNVRVAPSPARDRAEEVASRLAQRHGAWPTVSELESAAEVSRGTAAAALKVLRTAPRPLHPITRGLGSCEVPGEATTAAEKNIATSDETSSHP